MSTSEWNTAAAVIEKGLDVETDVYSEPGRRLENAVTSNDAVTALLDEAGAAFKSRFVELLDTVCTLVETGRIDTVIVDAGPLSPADNAMQIVYGLQDDLVDQMTRTGEVIELYNRLHTALSAREQIALEQMEGRDEQSWVKLCVDAMFEDIERHERQEEERREEEQYFADLGRYYAEKYGI